MPGFEDEVREWVRPVNGQYPRPWMSDTTDPEHAQVFIVGRNPATPIPVDLVSGREEFLDALFNRNGRTHAELYAKARARLGKGPSPTRNNIERLSALLKQRGARGVLETNVICYSTPMSADLGFRANAGGKEAGQRIFRALLRWVAPSVIVAHGSGIARDLARILGTSLPLPPGQAGAGIRSREVRLSGGPGGRRTLVLVIPSLAPPGWSRWASWADEYLIRVVNRAAEHLALAGQVR